MEINRMFVYIVEAQYQSDRHDTQYWGPIVKPTGKGYAFFSDKAKADALAAKLNAAAENDFGESGLIVGIMGNDFPIGYRVIKQSV
jgi:hypothetical protein